MSGIVFVCPTLRFSRDGPVIASAVDGCKRWNGLLLPCGIIVPPVNGLSGPWQGGVHVEHTTIAVDLAKSVFSGCGLASTRPCRRRAAAFARPLRRVLRATAAGDDRVGSLRVGALLGAAASTVRTRRSAAGPARR